MNVLAVAAVLLSADPWTVQTVPTPEGEVVEVGGIAFPDDDTIAVSTRRGRVWLIDGALDDNPGDAAWTRHVDGLYEGLGLDVDGNDLIVLQRGELSRLRDIDDDRIVDVVEVLSSDWGLSHNYHEFAFGLPRDAAGNRYVSLNLGFMSPDWWYGQSVEPYRGWILQVAPDGHTEPWAYGFRSPCGLGFDAKGRLLATDNQGDWMATSPIFVVQQDGFHGHPASLRWTEEFLADNRIPHQREPLDIDRVPPAIWIPYDWSRSTGNIVTDSTGGSFGPFEDQLFVAELTTGQVLRAEIEDIDGVPQGAVWPFVDRVGSVARVAFADDGSLICGLTNRGWGGLAPGHGVKRIVWNGDVPLEMKHVRLVSGGFDIEFTHPLSEAPTPEQIEVDTYDYNWWWKYGSPEQRHQLLEVESTRLSEDGRTLRVDIPQLSAGRVARLHLHDVSDATGRALRTQEVAYTINRIPGGPTRDVARRVSAPPLEDRIEEESGWLRLTWGDPKAMWEGDWRLAKDRLDATDRTRFTTESGEDALVNDQASTDYVFSGALPREAQVKLPIMLAKHGAIGVGLPGDAMLMIRDHDGSGTLEVVDSDGRVLAHSDHDVWRGAGQWHWVGFEVRDSHVVEVLVDDQKVLGDVDIPSGGKDRWLRFSGAIGAAGIADVRVRPVVDAMVGGESFPRDGSMTLTGPLSGAIGSEGLMLEGHGTIELATTCPQDFDLQARVRFSEGAMAMLSIGEIHVVVAEGQPGDPSTGSIAGVASTQVRLIPADAWYQLEVQRSGVDVRVLLNGLLVSSGTVPVGVGAIMLTIEEGSVGLEAMRLDAR